MVAHIVPNRLRCVWCIVKACLYVIVTLLRSKKNTNCMVHEIVAYGNRVHVEREETLTMGQRDWNASLTHPWYYTLWA